MIGSSGIWPRHNKWGSLGTLLDLNYKKILIIDLFCDVFLDFFFGLFFLILLEHLAMIPTDILKHSIHEFSVDLVHAVYVFALKVWAKSLD